MSYVYTGLGQNNLSKVKFWWNRTLQSPNPKYENVGQALSNKPPKSTVLNVNVYANESGHNRLIGSAAFQFQQLQRAGSIKAPVQRIMNTTKSGSITLNLPPSINFKKPTNSIIGNSLVRLYNNKTPIQWPVVQKHDAYFGKNPKVAHQHFQYFKWPLFYFGKRERCFSCR